MFVLCALAVALLERVPGDRALVQAVTDAVTDTVGTGIDRPARWVGYAGSAWALVPLAIGLALWAAVRRDWHLLAVVALTAALAWLVNPALKQVFTRERPGLRALVEPTSRWSFPAGHAVGAAAFATLVVLLAWPTRARWPVTIAAGGLVALVGVSRLVLGVHHPTDLVAGWALGVAVATGLAAWGLTRRRAPRADSHP